MTKYFRHLALFLLSCCGYVTHAYAINTVQENTAEKQPQILFGAMDIDPQSAEYRFLANEQVFQRSKPDRLLCWFAIDVATAGIPAQVIETFIAPQITKFSYGENQAKGVEQKIQTSHQPKLVEDKSVLEQCWRFDQDDPLGKYQLSVEINGVASPVFEAKLEP